MFAPMHAVIVRVPVVLPGHKGKQVRCGGHIIVDSN